MTGQVPPKPRASASSIPCMAPIQRPACGRPTSFATSMVRVGAQLISLAFFFFVFWLTPETIAAAMPSLHCGYALLIGVTVATYPLSGPHSATTCKRLSMVAFGLAYPALILTAVVATANHFILDAVAGALVCGVAWYCNEMLLNLCVLEDYFLWMLRIHKPASGAGTD